MGNIENQLKFDITQKLDEYFASKGKPDWNQGDGFVRPSYYCCLETKEVWEHWPAFCAADAGMSWRKFADSLDDAKRKLDYDPNTDRR